MNGELRIVDDVPAAFAELVESELRQFAARLGAVPPGGPDDADAGSGPGAERFKLAMSGGPTARRCYERLAEVEGLPWPRVEVFWSDERCVPPDDPDSNALLGHQALLDHVGPLAAVHPMSCDVGAPAYEALLQQAGSLDLVHLGLGPDGHTASLFAGSDALVSPGSALVALSSDPASRNPHPRITLTLAAINAAKIAVFTVAGTEKREALQRVRAGEGVPGALVASGRVIFLADPAAAGD
jgi:6-phosphogluconolactonase